MHWVSRSFLSLFATIALAPSLTGCTSQPASRPPVSVPPSAVLPWTASIGSFTNIVAQQTCTATLVRQDVILTAAHCLADGQQLASLQRFAFAPNEGAEPTLKVLPVIGVLALGEQTAQGIMPSTELVNDWALLRIETAPAALHPIAVNSFRWADIQARLAAGDTFYSGGYGTPGVRRLTQHETCGPVDAARYHFFLDDGLMASSCHVRPQDSGGPMILLDALGRPHLIAVISGIGDPNGANPLGIGVVSQGFVKYLNGLPISSVLGTDVLSPAG